MINEVKPDKVKAKMLEYRRRFNMNMGSPEMGIQVLSIDLLDKIEDKIEELIKEGGEDNG